MATEAELALFERELVTVRALDEAARWQQLERDESVPLGVFVVMHSIKASTELYKARFRWTNYFRAFSLKFIDMQTGSESNPKAWPDCPGFRPGNLDACIHLTAEGQALHPEWAGSSATRFPTVEVPMQFALLQVQSILDISYRGRGG